jgi:hypothetical protein
MAEFQLGVLWDAYDSLQKCKELNPMEKGLNPWLKKSIAAVEGLG